MERDIGEIENDYDDGYYIGAGAMSKDKINARIREIITRNVKYKLTITYYPYEDLEGIIFPDTITILCIEYGRLKTLSGAKLPAKLIVFENTNNDLKMLDINVFPDTLKVLICRETAILNIDNTIFPEGLIKLDLGYNKIKTISNVYLPESLGEFSVKNDAETELINPKFNSVVDINDIEGIKLNINTKEYNRNQLIFLYLIMEDMLNIDNKKKILDNIAML